MNTEHTAHIVVGMGYGDEGKGTTVDYLCNNKFNPIVIRFSGGPQAGHTIQVGDKRHIHSNFGSGTFRSNTPTLFSEHTLVYPVTIRREIRSLGVKGKDVPKLFVHPLAKIITPYDVYDNRNCGKNLNDGSCGLGIHKTMKRNAENPKLHAIDLLHPEIFQDKLNQILDYYREIWFKNGTLFLSNEWLVRELQEFMVAIKTRTWEIKDYSVLEDYHTLIFEGSQGILLDMDHGVFPHVTHANTTSKNAIDILDKIGWTGSVNEKRPTIYYVTRSYSTRHGNGPYVEQNVALLKELWEESNVYNKYQGNFKYSKIDYDKLYYALMIDRIYAGDCISILVVTCLDQQGEFDFDRVSNDYDAIFTSSSPDSKHFKID